jgi:hypothetical protein
VHFKIVELQFLVAHFARINWNIHVFGDMAKNIFYFISLNHKFRQLTLFPFEGFLCAKLAVDRGVHDDGLHLPVAVVDGVLRLDGVVAGALQVDDVEQEPKVQDINDDFFLYVHALLMLPVAVDELNFHIDRDFEPELAGVADTVVD